VLTYPVYREYFLCVLQAEVLTFPVYIDYFLCVAGGGVKFSCHREYFLCVAGGGVNSCGDLGGLLHYSCLRGARQAQSVHCNLLLTCKR
jgi:hypothetical protein